MIESYENENLVLREQNVGLQEQVALLEKALKNAATESHGPSTSGKCDC